MPRRTLSNTTRAPAARNSAAIAISALRCPSARRPSRPSAIRSPSVPPCAPVFFLLPGDEAGLLYQRQMASLLARHPLSILLAAERRGVERALLHQLLPF